MKRWGAVIGIASLFALSACAANPGPPPVVEQPAMDPYAESSTAEAAKQRQEREEERQKAEEEKRPTVAVGVDPLKGGLNPHLVANNSELVHELATLVLPSAFRGGQLDTDILESAEEVPAPKGVEQRVRYTIASPAQWSDGTPITGSDFHYLWQQMVTNSGVNNPAGYHAISAVTTTEGGRVVTVDFSQRVQDWHLLFSNLLPAHLVQDGDFASALANGIPASAGRYRVDSVDRGRGLITLNRNDRFWGKQPATIDVIQLRFVRSTVQAVDMLRSGQIGYLDFSPEQTSLEALSMLDGVNVGVEEPARQLRLHLSANPESLPDPAARRALAATVDTDQVARLATGRASQLRPGVNPIGGEVQFLALRERAGKKPIRIGVDPTEPTALAAAHVVADGLRSRGIDAEVLSERLTTITTELLPQGEVDAVVTWEETPLNSLTAANLYLCTPEDALAGDLSGYCPEKAAATRGQILSGAISPQEALERARELNATQALYVPLLDETRIHALGRGIVGPGQSVEDWRGGLTTAPQWRIDEQ